MEHKLKNGERVVFTFLGETQIGTISELTWHPPSASQSDRTKRTSPDQRPTYYITKDRDAKTYVHIGLIETRTAIPLNEDSINRKKRERVDRKEAKTSTKQQFGNIILDETLKLQKTNGK